MSTANRKIGFFEIELIGSDGIPCDPKDFFDFLLLIAGLSDASKLLLQKDKNRVYSLESCVVTGQKCHVIMGSAKYAHRPPIVNVRTGKRRPNTKHTDEGDLEKTHIGLMARGDSILMLLEQRTDGVARGRFIWYLNNFLLKLYRVKPWNITMRVVGTDDFLAQVTAGGRITLGEFYVSKQIIGTEFKDIAKSTEELVDRIQVTTRTHRGGDQSSFIASLYQKYFGRDKKVERIRAYGVNLEGEDIVLDTDLCKLVERIEVELDGDTDTVDSTSIFRKFDTMLQQFKE